MGRLVETDPQGKESPKLSKGDHVSGLVGLNQRLADTLVLLEVLHEAFLVERGEVSAPSPPIVRELVSLVTSN